MCIRDRLQALRHFVDVAESGWHALGDFAVLQSVDLVKGVGDDGADRRVIPVSYTHLDVYKRQVYVYGPSTDINDCSVTCDNVDAGRMACLLYTSRCV